MTRTAQSNRGKTNRPKPQRLAALALTTALATAALTGCTTNAAPPAGISASKAQVALERGDSGEAVEHAEAAVLAQPRNAQFRAVLGAAYMEAGRFESAATSFQDAMSLGGNSPRNALSLALAETAVGRYAKAAAVLDDWRDALDPADLGLALALAGQPERGAQVLANALRAGQNTSKVRQNLAYAYALSGDWRAARLMAAEDVPPDQINQRIGEWARSVQPEMYQARVATLLGAPLVSDPGQPVVLALVNNPSSEQLAAEAAALAYPAPEQQLAAAVPAPAPAGELAPVDPTPHVAVVQPPVAAPATVQAAFAAPAPAGASPAQITESMVAFISQPVVQKMPARYGAEVEPRRSSKGVTQVAAKRATGPAPVRADGSHLIQLGSFLSREGARRAWGIYAERYDNLDRYRMVITEARVRGKTYYRVSAGGFQSADALSMCSTVKAGGEGCIAWAQGRPLPGAVDRGVRMARR